MKIKNKHVIRFSIVFHYLVLLIPAEVGSVCKLLRPFHHEVDKVAATPEATDDQEVSQNSEEPAKVDVFIFLVLLLVYDGLLFLAEEVTKPEFKSWG